MAKLGLKISLYIECVVLRAEQRKKEAGRERERERAIKWHKKRYHRRRDVTEGHSEEEMEEGEEGGTSQHEIWSSPRSQQLSSPSATNGSTNNRQIKGEPEQEEI